MQIRHDLPQPIREIENTWIPLTDGTRLAARIWLPLDAERRPVPAILEYLPYRKDDLTAFRDAFRHPYFAGHGYAAIRVDMRGSGDSGGIMYDEYLAQEQDDGLEVLAWIAAQPWCTGAVGIIGISWGGFNGLQIAARRPPELKAVISLCSTDDRYADDVHYMGGCLQANDALHWATTMLAYNACPPDPRFVGADWRAIWLDRMERTPPYIEAWLAHQWRDDYWRHGSIAEDYGAIDCPVYMVGGWADGYTNAIPRTLAGLRGPRKGLIGPWSHNYPEQGVPGPAIGFAQECLRWWDYWLKGIETGIMDEPLLRAWVQESAPPASAYAERPGRWVAAPGWPDPATAPQRYALNPGALDAAPAPAAHLTIAGAQTAGLDAGVWCPYGAPGDFAPDQRGEDGLALCFTSAALAEPADVLGFPELTLTVASDQPNALLAVRLCDVAPDGASALVSRGLLNLTHRDGHAQPAPLEPGQRYTVTVRLNAIGHRIAAGHRWRIALSPTYWPHAWPSPAPVTLSVFTGGDSALVLPARAPQPADEQLAPFGPPEGCAPLATAVLRAPARRRTITRDAISGAAQLIDHNDGGCRRILASDTEFDLVQTDTYTIVEGDPLSAHQRCARAVGLARGGWRTRVEATSTLTADAAAFHVTNLLEAYEGNTRVFSKAWVATIERRLV